MLHTYCDFVRGDGCGLVVSSIFVTRRDYIQQGAKCRKRAVAVVHSPILERELVHRAYVLDLSISTNRDGECVTA
jgi:hypothetical protein